MWLLNTRTYQLKEFTGFELEHTPYAILSHRWEPEDETYSFQSIKAIYIKRVTTDDGESMPPVSLFPFEFCASPVDANSPSPVHPPTPTPPEKVVNFCSLAAQEGYEWVWLDTCCIDKTSSAELSEAINSMYEWYELAAVCYTYLADVPDDDVPELPDSYFRRSRWHTRGWTLQELIAPRYHIFLSGPNWTVLGSKLTLAHVLEEVSGIEAEVLNHQKPVGAVSVAKRMWWASKRQTTRIEDEAYSLMGIFGVNMPTVYGEGQNAFVRLQEEILKDRKSTRLNSSHSGESRMPSSA